MAENMSFERVTTEYYDVLKELGNIGAGNATTALAQMLQTKVDMKVPQVRLLDFKDVGVVMGGEEQLVAGIYLAVEGDITGSIMFILDKNAAKSHGNATGGRRIYGDRDIGDEGDRQYYHRGLSQFIGSDDGSQDDSVSSGLKY